SQRRLAPRNSLRELRSLRSDRRGENEDDARCARAPALLRFSAAHKRTRGRRPAPLQAAWRRARRTPLLGAPRALPERQPAALRAARRGLGCARRRPATLPIAANARPKTEENPGSP